MDRQPAADDVAAAQDVKAVLLATGESEHGASRIDLPGVVAIPTEWRFRIEEPGGCPELNLQRLELRLPGYLAGRCRQQAGHWLRGSVQQMDLAAEIGQTGPLGVNSAASPGKAAERLRQAM